MLRKFGNFTAVAAKSLVLHRKCGSGDIRAEQGTEYPDALFIYKIICNVVKYR